MMQAASTTRCGCECRTTVQMGMRESKGGKNRKRLTYFVPTSNECKTLAVNSKLVVIECFIRNCTGCGLLREPSFLTSKVCFERSLKKITFWWFVVMSVFTPP